MCLLLLFSLFDLSDGSKVVCAIIRSGLQSVHTQKSPKGHNIASCEQRVSDAHAWLWCHCCESSQSHTGQVGTTAGTTLIPLLCSPERSSGVPWQLQLRALLSMDRTPILKTGLFKSELLLNNL